LKIKGARAIGFVVRCAGAATVAYELALLLGLPASLWAAMSALVVSQERVNETQSSFVGRVLGTSIGIVTTVSVSEVASRMGVGTATQMAVAVAICAVVAHNFPTLRVAMWTCPLILLTAQPSVPIVIVALRRGSEVMLGAMVGWAFHWVADFIADRIAGAVHALLGRDAARHARR
jgi:uncharacterized membrane protein YccC